MHQHVLLYIKQGLEAYQKAFSPVIIIEDQYLQTFVHTLRYHLSLIHYTNSFGVTKAAVKYKTNRQYIYLWMRRFDVSIESLCDRSRRPQYHSDAVPGPWF